MTTKRRMGQLNIKTPIKVAVYIRPGPSTPAVKTVWRAWWRRLITSVREELESEGKGER